MTTKEHHGTNVIAIPSGYPIIGGWRGLWNRLCTATRPPYKKSPRLQWSAAHLIGSRMSRTFMTIPVEKQFSVSCLLTLHRQACSVIP